MSLDTSSKVFGESGSACSLSLRMHESGYVSLTELFGVSGFALSASPDLVEPTRFTSCTLPRRPDAASLLLSC